MAKKYDIDIDSYIGDWNSSKWSVKNKLSKMEGEVIVRVNSLGGNVDTALDIAAQFEAQGNVTCDLYAFNASAATVLTLGAKKVRMHENSMYLIHKALIWIDAFGTMNEDDLETLIQNLKSKQENSAIVTLNLANMYAKKSGKSIQEILNLMKEEKWLNAETAIEWGFVDEIFSGAIPTKEPDNIMEMMNVANLPIPESLSNEESPENEPKDDVENISRKDFVKEIVSGLKNIFSNQNKPDAKMSKKMINAVIVAALLNVEEIEAVDNKVELTSEQITDIENAISEKDLEIENLKKEVAQKDKEKGELETEVENLKKAPGDKTEGVDHGGEGAVVNKGEVDIVAVRELYNLLPD